MIDYLKEKLLSKVQLEVDSLGVGGLKGQISDGYHTFDELYEHRIILFICLCKTINEIVTPFKPKVWRSKHHSDGTAWSGWFLLGLGTEKGEQITYHLPISKWDDCSFATEVQQAPEFDGHTSSDVLTRLCALAGI